MIRFFIDVALPSLAISTAWLGALGFWATRRIRAYRTERQALWQQRRTLRQAQDALAAVIADPLASQGTRDQALPAYEALGRLSERESS